MKVAVLFLPWMRLENPLRKPVMALRRRLRVHDIGKKLRLYTAGFHPKSVYVKTCLAAKMPVSVGEIGTIYRLVPHNR
jgi:hypothetical protein